MRHAAKVNNWKPGVYDIFDKDFTVQLEHWGDKMLNADSEVMKFKDVGCIKEPKFIRPTNDSKHFAGRVFEPEEFNEWFRKIVVMEFDYGNDFSGETVVQVCNPKEIFAEYRYWIVDGKIVTKSLYKRGGKVIYSPEVDRRFDIFVSGCTSPMSTDCWNPHNAFVIDVCDTPEGIKIVEINTINASGFYAADMQKLVMALEDVENYSK